MWKRIWGPPIGLAIIAVALFVSAGRLDLPFFWVYLALLLVAAVVAIRAIDPELLRERVSPGSGGTDRYLRFTALPFFVAHLIVAGLDAGRFRWSGDVPDAVQIAALVLMAGSFALSIRAMQVNRFFSPVVRIQTERGHHLVTAGPYAWMRHPGYAAALLTMLASGPALGAWWSMLLLVPVVALILRRTLIEDRYIRENLEGYAAYAERVPSRLIPGVW